MRLISFLFIFVLSITFSTHLLAKENPEELWAGMSYAEVINKWGAPVEKIVREGKREDLWLYKESQVKFVEGRVVESSYRKLIGMKEAPVVEEIDEDLEEDIDEELEKSQVEDILTEIMTGNKTSAANDNKGKVGARRRRK